jgi:hypothetical protein
MSPGVLLTALLLMAAPAHAQQQDAPKTDPAVAVPAPEGDAGRDSVPGAVAADEAAAGSEASAPSSPGGAPPDVLAPGASSGEGPAAVGASADAAADGSVASPDGSGAPANAAEAGTGDGSPPLKAIGDKTVLYDRLFGESGEGSDGDTVAPPAPGLGIKAPSVPGWLWVVGILGGIGLLVMRSRSLKALRGPDAISVVSRSQLGKDGSLAVVEVAEADGEKRRLLVGFGGGAPRLVADLGRPFPELPVLPEPKEAAPLPLVERAETLGPRAVPHSDLVDNDGGAGPSGRANAAGAWARAVRDAGGPVPAPPAAAPTAAPVGRLDRHRDLIEEVLAERGDDDVQEVGG